MATDRLIALVDALLDAHVEFIVIGGLAAVLHGAPLVTADVDIVHRKSPENIAAAAVGPAAPARACARR